MASPVKSAPVIDWLRRRGYRVARVDHRRCRLEFALPGHGWRGISLYWRELWAFAKLEGM